MADPSGISNSTLNVPITVITTTTTSTVEPSSTVTLTSASTATQEFISDPEVSSQNDDSAFTTTTSYLASSEASITSFASNSNSFSFNQNYDPTRQFGEPFLPSAFPTSPTTRFIHNKPAMAVTFTILGVLLLVVFLIFFVCLRKRLHSYLEDKELSKRQRERRISTEVAPAWDSKSSFARPFGEGSLINVDTEEPYTPVSPSTPRRDRIAQTTPFRDDQELDRVRRFNFGNPFYNHNFLSPPTGPGRMREDSNTSFGPGLEKNMFVNEARSREGSTPSTGNLRNGSRSGSVTNFIPTIITEEHEPAPALPSLVSALNLDPPTLHDGLHAEPGLRPPSNGSRSRSVSPRFMNPQVMDAVRAYARRTSAYFSSLTPSPGPGPWDEEEIGRAI